MLSHAAGSHNDRVRDRIALGDYGIDILAHGLDADYIAGVVDDRIAYVVTAAAWLPAGSTNCFVRERHDVDDRIEFVGRTASQDIQDQYVGKRIPANERPTYFGPFLDKVHLVDGTWLPETPRV